MKNFGLIHRGNPDIVSPLLASLVFADWGVSEFDQLRTDHEQTPHYKVSSITLRNNDYPYMDGLNCYWTPEVERLPQFKSIIFDTARVIEATSIGRVIITKLPPFAEIPPHIDEGKYVKAFHRFHVCLQANRNTSFTVEDETVFMKPGQVWWMNNKALHSVKNPGKLERLHLIIDLKRD